MNTSASREKRAATHTLYIDDSGTKEYAPPGASYDHGNSRYFVLGGVLMRFAHAGQLTEAIRQAKLHTFGSEHVEVKSNWLRMPGTREAKYLQPYGISEEDLREFIEEYYAAIGEARLTLLASVVDKQHMKEVYGDRAYYPPAVGYEALLQRVQNALGDKGESAYVTLDDMPGKTAKGSPYKDNLIRQHKSLKQHGSRLIHGSGMGAVRGRIKFVDSAKSHMVQVADIVAYNVFRQFREFGAEWETRGLAQLPTYDWFKRLAGKFRSGRGGRIQGYGVVKVPLKKRVQWRVTRSRA